MIEDREVVPHDRNETRPEAAPIRGATQLEVLAAVERPHTDRPGSRPAGGGPTRVSDRDLGNAVVVEIPRRRDGVAEHPRLRALEARDDVSVARADDAHFAGARGADDEVAPAVAVHILDRREREAEVAWTLHPPEHHPRLAREDPHAIPHERTHGDVLVPIPVGVADRGERGSGPGFRIEDGLGPRALE